MASNEQRALIGGPAAQPLSTSTDLTGDAGPSLPSFFLFARR